MFFLSPQSFIFSIFYLLLLFAMFCTRNFFVFWVVIELRTLVFIGISYTAFKNNFSSLLLFFIIQSLSAFSLILFYFIDSNTGFTLSLILKLAMFPFFYWYVNLIPRFNNFMFFLSRTVFKLPSVFIIINFYYSVNMLLLFFSAVLTVILGAVIIINSRDLRFVLICSSVVNNSWFLFSQYTNRVLFIMYFLLYGSLLLYILFTINRQSSNRFTAIKHRLPVTFCLFTMAGLPPFPLFFVKIMLVYYLVFTSISSFYVFFLILLRVVTMLGYLKYIFSSLMYSNSSNIVIL